MGKWIVIVFLVCAVPVTAMAQAPTNEQLFQMIKNVEKKLDAAIGEANKAKEEAASAKAEAARARAEADAAKAELARIKGESGAPVEDKSLVKTPDTKSGFGISGEAVFLKPRRSNLDFVIEDKKGTSASERVHGEVIEVEPSYDIGWRAAIVYSFGSGTDIQAQFTNISTDDREEVSVEQGGYLWGTRLHPNSNIDDRRVTYARADYEFDHYAVDLALGQHIDVGENFGLFVSGGARYAKIAQVLDIHYLEDLGVLQRWADIAEKNTFRGWGPRIGLGADWRFWDGFNIFTSVAGSLLIGDFHLSYTEADDASNSSKIYRVDIEGKEDRVIPVVEARAGLGYEYTFSNGASMGVKTGYEWQNWFNMVSVDRFNDDVDSQLIGTDTTDLAIHGFFFELFINFFSFGE
jgi:hypothetical protein